jgi:hypothetical protein
VSANASIVGGARQERDRDGFGHVVHSELMRAIHQLACHGLPHIPPGPENPFGFGCRNVLILTFFYPTNLRS